MTISDEAQVGAARRAVRRFATDAGFGDVEMAKLDIVVQEIGTNAVRYATNGGCLHWTTPLGAQTGLEIFYWDKGPGMDDLERSLRDGVSTGGGLGAGLGTIRRLLDDFHAYSSV
ncbi:MAG: ATP-binding protein, partial [Pyrinomonadaceae bacterium]